ncbi:MAG: tRNA (adenosine(37)-N6)-dimethylallyltransferase MiaA [Cyanobacteriota bacterium]
MEHTGHPSPLVIAVVGPTASGKTDLGIAIAEALDLAVLSVDSRQLYRGMDIGTAKPTTAQRSRVRHELLDLREPDRPINVQEFSALALGCIDREHARRGIALLVGGSGLYLQAITGGIQPPAVPAQPWLRQQLEQLGQPACHALLGCTDPASAARIAPADAVRTQRALEIHYATGALPSSLRRRTAPPWRLLELGLDPADLAGRIRRRTRTMYAAGLLPETAALLERFGAHCPLLDTIGYGEARRLLAGDLDLEAAIALSERRTWQYARRQRTWFRRQHQPAWLDGPRSDRPTANGADLLSRALLAINRVLG